MYFIIDWLEFIKVVGSKRYDLVLKSKILLLFRSLKRQTEDVRRSTTPLYLPWPREKYYFFEVGGFCSFERGPGTGPGRIVVRINNPYV
jgi:hypothetical protein